LDLGRIEERSGKRGGGLKRKVVKTEKKAQAYKGFTGLVGEFEKEIGSPGSP